MQAEKIVMRRLTVTSIPNAIRHGWGVFSKTKSLSVGFSTVFALIGLLSFVAIDQAGVAPMILPVAGGFMLLAPILLCGFFAIGDRVEGKQIAGLSDVYYGFSRIGRELLALALVCMLLFLIWITDAATLYGFMVGRTPSTLLMPTPQPDKVWSFMLWSSAMGAVLAFVIYSIAAFAVPLLYYRRAGLVQAVVLSVRTVFSNFRFCVLWAILLSASIIGSILVLPLFLVTLPVLAFASHALYHELFPEPRVLSST